MNKESTRSASRPHESIATHSTVSEEEDPQEIKWKNKDAAQDTIPNTLSRNIQYTQHFGNLSITLMVNLEISYADTSPFSISDEMTKVSNQRTLALSVYELGKTNS